MSPWNMPTEFIAYWIIWEDAMGCPGWNSPERAREFIEEDNITTQTLGFLIHEDEHYIVLAASTQKYSLGDCLKIPRSMIRDMYQLKDKPDVLP